MNAPREGRNHCHKCKARKYKHAHPMRYAFNLLRCGANRRGIAFTITFQDYRELWEANPEKWEAKRRNLLRSNCPQGRSNSKTWEVDRDKPYLGYERGNLQILPKCSNVAKGNRERWMFLGATGRVGASDGYVHPF